MFKVDLNCLEKIAPTCCARFFMLAKITFKKIKAKPFSISVAFVSPAIIAKTNKVYRGKNKATDVLSFLELNEILICPAVAKIQASKAKHSLKLELETLFVHGLLHLLGYDDTTPKQLKQMEDLACTIIAEGDKRSRK